MYIVLIAWLYVALMMAIAEATSPVGSVLGAIFTFILYGLLPMAIVGYVMGTPARRKARQAAEHNATEFQVLRQIHAAKRPVTPSRLYEKNLDACCTVHQASLLSFPAID
jgi:hypothetical protein